MQKKGFNLIQVIIIIIATAIISGLTVTIILSKDKSVYSSNKYSELLNDNNIQEFLEAYSELTTKYYKDIDKKELINHAINSMTDYLNESYTAVLDENSLNRLVDQINGTNKGIGIITVDNIIIYVDNNSPAEKAGIIEKDVLTHINDIPVNGKSNNEILTIISNESTVKLTITRDGNNLEYDVPVESIDLPSTYFKLIDNKIGYIKISTFSKNLSSKVMIALDYFEAKKVNKVIIDIRDNPGGYIKSAKEVASLFTKKGDTIYIVDNENERIKYVDEDNINKEFKIVVLINNQTASASEVLAAALHDNVKASLVGQKTYGKGRIQHIYRLSSGSTLKYTSALWYTPLEKSIDEVGIMPDYIIENKKEYSKDGNQITNVTDSQLQYAKKLLLKK